MEGCRMMLKKCSIGRLKEGMVLGQDVHRSDMTVLLGEGTILTSKMIDALADHDIFSVQIQVEDEEEAAPAKAASALEEPPADAVQEKPAKVAPKKEKLQDDSYVLRYIEVFASLKKFYADTRENLRIDVGAAQSLAREFLPLCESAKAIVQIYNVEAEEDH